MYKRKYSRLSVKISIRRMARWLKKEHVVNENTLFLVILDGGVWFASHFFDALGDMNNEVQFIKCHSYKGKERGEFTWDIPPVNLAGREVVIIEDMNDSGQTLNAVYTAIKDQVEGAVAVTLLCRSTSPEDVGMLIYTCIEDDSMDFFVGCGLDCNGRGRLMRHLAVC